MNWLNRLCYDLPETSDERFGVGGSDSRAVDREQPFR